MTEQQPPSDSAEDKLDLLVNATRTRKILARLADKEPESLEEVLNLVVNQPSDPLHKKINEEHISTVLANSAREKELELDAFKIGIQDEQSRRWYQFIVVLASLAIAVLILILFRHNDELLKYLFSAALGFIGGFGLGRKSGSSGE